LKPPEISVDETGLSVNGIRISHEGMATEVETALRGSGNRMLFGPEHLAKPTDNRGVVFSDAGIVLLERIGDGRLSQMDCLFDPRESPIGDVSPFEGRLELLGARVEALIPSSVLRKLRSKASREFLKSEVFELGGLLVYMRMGKRVSGEGRSGVSVLSVSVGPKTRT
jgi:hypothetical protein